MSELKNHVFANEDRYGIGNKLEEFVLLQYLGGGNSYHYSKVKSKLNNEIYCMKTIINIDHNTYERKEKNLQFLRTIENENILKYYSSFLENSNYHIIMEYAENGNLKNFIKIHKILNQKIDEAKLNDIYFQSMEALSNLHLINVVHKKISSSSLFLNKDGIVKLGEMDLIAQKVNDKDFENDLFSLGRVFYHLRNLIPKYKLYPNMGDTGSIYIYENIDEKKEINKEHPEDSMLNEVQNNAFEKGKYKNKIKENYYNIYGKCSNTSIESVYFCLIYLLEHQKINIQNFEERYKNKITIKIDRMKLEKRKIKLSELFSQGPVSQSLSIVDLKKLRDNLIVINKSFNRFGEIPPHELIKFLIKNLHIENNKDRKNNYSRIFNLSYEKDNLREYLKAYRSYFDSVISNTNKGFFGTYQFENTCSECKKIFKYYESFYYINLDLDDGKINKNDFKIGEYLQPNKDVITVYKHCPDCKKATKQVEVKSIYKCPCRLVILIKNTCKNVKLIEEQKVFFEQPFNNVVLDYLLVNTINYNEEAKKYVYRYYQILENGTSNWQYSDNNNSKLKMENVVALFYLYMGDSASFDNANEIPVKSSQGNNYLFSNN